MWIFPIDHFLSFVGPLRADDDRSRLKSRIYGSVEAPETGAGAVFWLVKVEERGSSARLDARLRRSWTVRKQFTRNWKSTRIQSTKGIFMRNSLRDILLV